MRRRIAAVLRAAHRVVGLRRKRLALGSLAGAGGIAAMLASMMALLPLPARANTIPVSSSCTSGGTNGTVGRISMPNTADGAAGTGFPLAGGSGTFSLAAGCSATVDVSVLGGTAYGGYASVSGQGGVAVGFNSQAATWSLAAGLETRATSTGSTALGFGSQALSANAIAIGGAGGDGKTALSVANSTIANAAGSIAIGANASRGAQTGGTDSIAIGGQSTVASGATSGIALGRGSAVNNTGGIAVGDAATVSGNNGVALGINAKASNTGDVALGAGAQTSSVAVTTSTTINGQAYTFAGGAPQGTVSVGRQDGDKFYRTITNLGAGQLTATSQDAVNGSQLFATNQAVGSLASSTATTLGGGAAVSGGGIASFSVPLNNVGTTGAVSGTTTAQTTVGGALAALNTSVGNAANIAVKYDSVAGSTITLGATGGILPSKAPTVKITNLTAGALGSSSSDAVNGSQLYATNQTIANIQAGGGIKYFHANSTLADSSASGNDSLAIGPGATAYGNGAIAQGSSATAGVSGKAGTFTNDIAIGTSATSSGGNGLAIGANTVALGQSAVALGFGATASNTGDVALGAASTTAATIQTKSVSLNGTSYSFAGATPTNTVSIGQAGGERTLTNLAAGRLSASSTDAVNGSQLYATDQALGTLGALGPSVATALGAGASYDASTGKVSGFSQPINGVDTVGAVGAPTNQTTVAGALTALNNNVANTASVAVKYDSATSPGQITLGAVGGMLPTGQGTVKITNLTAGTLGASSTDAVNGSQLYATNQNLSTLTTNVNNGIVGPVQRTATTNQLALVAAGGSVAVPGVAQRLSNLASGTLSAASTDAVNGSQLYATNQFAQTQATQIANLGTTAAGLLGATAAYDTGTGKITGFSQSINAIDATGAVNATPTTQSTVSGALTALNTNMENVANIAVKYDAAGGNTITLGATGGTLPSAQGTVKIANLTAGTLSASSTDAVNGSQLYATNQTVTNLTNGALGPVQQTGTPNQLALVAKGGTGAAPGAAQSLTNLAVGALSTASTDAVNGSQLFQTNQNIANGAVGLVQQTGTANHLALVAPGATGAAPGAVQALGNLAAGSLSVSSTEAVNGSQLYAAGSSTVAALGGGATYNTTTGAVTAPSYTVGGATYNSVGDAFTAIDTGGIKYFHANSTLADSSAGGTDSIAIGPKASAVGVNAIALGNGAAANGANGIALGRNIVADALGENVAIGSSGTTAKGGSAGGGAVAIGRNQVATGDGAVSIGEPNLANGNGAVALGRNNTAAGDLVGTTSAIGAVAIGDTNMALGQGAVAIGKSSTANAAGALALGDTATAQAAKGVALGSGATASNASDVALGAGSATAAAVATGSARINGTIYTFAGVAPSSTVSVGAAGAERTLTNLAAGRIAATSTDAVNGSQLFATNQAIETLGALGPSVAATLGAGTSYDAGTGKISGFSAPLNTVDATGAMSAATTASTTVGGALATLNANVNNTANVAVKYDSATSPGQITLGATGGTLPVGQGTVKITNLAAGTLSASSTDAVNGSQLYATNQNIANGAVGPVQQTGATNQLALVAPGGTGAAPGAAQTLTNLAAGTLSASSAEAVNGSQLYATNQSIINGTAGPVQQTGTANRLALVAPGGSGALPGTAQTLANLADGTLTASSREAVNGSQLFTTNQTVATLGPTTASTLGGGASYGATTGITGFSQAVSPVSSVGAIGGPATFSSVGDALTGLNASLVNTANIAVKYDQAANPSQITLGATGGTLPAGASTVKITNLTAGTVGASSTDAVNGSQLYAVSQSGSQLGTTIASTLGGNTSYDATTGKVAGFSQPIRDVGVLGAVAAAPINRTTVSEALGALDTNIVNTASIAVKYDNVGGNTITLGATGGVLPGGASAVKITNLASGTVSAASTDAVNGSQLFAVGQSGSQLGTSIAGILAGGTVYNPTTGGLSGFSQAINDVATSGAVAAPTGQTTVAGALGALNTNMVNTANIAVKYDAVGASTITLGATGGTLPAAAPAVKISNLAAATLNPTSSEAVNGSQLYATNQNVANITSGAAGPVQRTTSANQLALVAVGGTASAPGATQSLTNLADGTVAAGSTDAVSGSQLYATNQSIAGQGTQVTNLGTTIATTLGGSATYDTSSGKILGFSQSINPIDATGAVGAAAAQTTVSGALTALNANALNTANIAVKYDTAGGNTITLGATGGTLAPGASPVKITNLAAGVVSATSRDAVNGAQLNATNEVVTNIASGGLGPVQRTASTNQLALVAPTGSGAVPGATQILTNLASGALSAASTDAVNGSQLHAAGTSIATALGGGASFDASTGKIAAPIYTVGGTTYGDVGSALAAIGTSVSGGGIKYFHANSTLADSQSTGADSVAIGPAAVANAGNAIALGKGAVASGTSSIAIGTGNKVTGIGSGAIGDPNIVAGAGSYAVGNNNTVANANSFVVGSGVTTTQDNSVVLGNKSSDRAAVAVTGTAINGTTYSFAGVGAPANGVVSVGSVGAERQIVNVAAGTVSATSTDAVNGSQLYAANQAVGTLGAQVNTLTVNVANGAVGPVQRTGTANQLALVAPDGTGAAPEAAQTLTNLAAGKLSSASTDAVNGGQLYATNQAINGIQNGGGIKYFHANSTAADSQAVGVGSVAAGPQSVATGSNSVALGNGAAAANANDVALGSGSTTVAAVGTASGTVNGTVYTYAGATPSSTVSVGSAGSERTVTNVAAGRVNATSTDAVNGSQLFATNSAVTSLATGLGTGGQNAVRYDLDGTGQKTNTVTLQGGDPNAPVLIRNVAAGVADSDAANLGQVKAVSSAATTIANGYTDMQVGAALQTAVSYTNQVAAQTLQQANAYTDMRFGQLSQQIGEVQKEARQAAAIGLAASSLRYDERPGKLSAAVGGGTWKGYAAGAMGLGYTSENQRVRANVSATTTGDAWGVGAGLSFTLN